MDEYLRPETLFGKSKFDGYYAAKDEPVISEERSQQARIHPKPEHKEMHEDLHAPLL